MNNDNSYWILRGGCCYFGARNARVANRRRSIPSNRYDSLGVRLWRVVNPLQQLSEVINEQ